MAPVSIPVLIAGLATCALVEKFRWCGFGVSLRASVRVVLEEHHRKQAAQLTARDRAVMTVQAAAALLLVCALALHVAEVGLIGLLIIILTTAFNGITDEHRLGKRLEQRCRSPHCLSCSSRWWRFFTTSICSNR